METETQAQAQGEVPIYDCTFENEIGNTIHVSTGTYYEPKLKGEGIFIKIIGPTSEHGNYITKKEAEKMYEALGKILTK